MVRERVELVYASATAQTILSVEVGRGATVREVIQISGILAEYPEIDLDTQVVGIFSKKVSLDTIVQSGDRIEIYRPLLIDPKEARKQRAKQAVDL